MPPKSDSKEPVKAIKITPMVNDVSPTNILFLKEIADLKRQIAADTGANNRTTEHIVELRPIVYHLPTRPSFIASEPRIKK